MTNKPLRPPPAGHLDWWNWGANPVLPPNTAQRRATAPQELTAQEQAEALRDLHENGFQ